jgi:hypothetical protein
MQVAGILIDLEKGCELAFDLSKGERLLRNR